jgi:hypothetical protein
MTDERTQLNVKINARVHWLAMLCARHLGISLAEFVEAQLAEGITRDAMLSRQDRPRKQAPISPLFYESLWSDDEATRIFHVAFDAQDLLTESQRKAVVSISTAVASQGKKLTLRTFRQHYAAMKGDE